LPQPNGHRLTASAGIGQYTALAFARHGIQRLALADMNLEALKAANAALSSKFPSVEILALQMNVQDAKQVEDGVSQAVSKFGRLDIAVNNAGIGGSGRKTHEIEEAEWFKVVDVDLNGVWRCQREQIKHMLGQE
jgi:NAD(P)-dependent dehydrogenase (short-subunit alcohol dehydrogenase family)